jgi:hypothetical protein
VYRIDVVSNDSEGVWEGHAVGIATSPAESIAALSTASSIIFWDYGTDAWVTFHQRRPMRSLSEWTSDGVYFVSVDETNITHVWTKKSSSIRPHVRIEAPEDAATVTGTITIWGSAESEHDMNTIVWVRIGASDWTPANGFLSWNYTLNTSLYSDGPLTIRARAMDPKGYSSIDLVSINVRNGGPLTNERPTVVLTKPQDHSSVWGVFEIAGVAHDDSQIRYIQVMIGDSHWITINTGPQETDVEWTYYTEIYHKWEGMVIKARSFDGILFSETVQIEVDVSEGEPPSSRLQVEILYPEKGEEVQPNFTVVGTVVEGEAEKVLVRLGFGEIRVANGSKTWTLTFSGVPIGAVSVGAMAINETHQSPWTYRSFYVRGDLPQLDQPPIVGILSPRNGSVVKERIEVSGWSYDDVIILRIELRFEGNEWIIADGTNNWNAILHAPGEGTRWVTVEARAYDGEQYSSLDSVRLFINSDEIHVEDNPIMYVTLLVILVILVIALSWNAIRRR